MCSDEHYMLEHIETLSTKYGGLCHEKQIKLLLNINAIHPLVFFSLNFLPFFFSHKAYNEWFININLLLKTGSLDNAIREFSLS